MAIEAMDATSPHDADTSASTTKSAAKAFANKYRGVMMRPMTTAVTKAQADFKPFVVNQEDIDHNLYGRFLGILKDAGVPWKAKRLPESREDAMHIMNAMVAAINAYQHYQKDVERAYHEIESSMASSKTHSHNQAADVSKLHNEVTMLRKKLAGTENNLAKTNNDMKSQISSLKSKLAQTERELNDSQIQARKLEKSLQLEKKQADHLMSKIMSADKPKFGKAARASSSARSPGQNVAAEPSNEASENSVSKSSPGVIPQIRNGATTPRKPNTVRSPLPWLENDEEGLDRPRHEYQPQTPATASATPAGATSPPQVGGPELNSVPLETSPSSPPNGPVNGDKTGAAVHKVQVTAAGSPATTASGSLSDEEAGDEEGIGGDGVPKSKSRFKKFLKTFKMSTKTKDGKDPAPTAGHNSKALSTTLPKHFGTSLKC